MKEVIRDAVNDNIQTLFLPLGDTPTLVNAESLIDTVPLVKEIVSYSICQPEVYQVVEKTQSSLISMSVEYLLIMLIIIFCVDIGNNYKAIMKSVIKMSNSNYLTKRFLQSDSFTIKQFFLRIKILTSLSITLFVLRVVVFHELSIFSDFQELVFVLIFAFVSVVFWFKFLYVKFLKMIFKEHVAEVAVYYKLFFVHLIPYCFFILIAVLLTYCFPENNNLISKIFLTSGCSLLFLYNIIKDCNFFYSEKILFLKFILYFCAVKIINMICVGYLFLRLFNIDIV